MTKKQMLATIREFTRDGYTFSVMQLSDDEMDLIRDLEIEGSIVHAAFAENWNGSKMGYIAK